MKYLIYHPVGGPSAKRLAKALGIKAVRSLDKLTKVPEWLIRWGSGRQINAIPKHELNRRSCLNAYGTRHGQLTKLRKAGVSVPDFWTGAKIPIPFHGVLFGRDNPKGKQPTGGVGCTWYEDGLHSHSNHDFYIIAIPKVRQFRVHVMPGATRTRELVPENPTCFDEPIWNLSTGFTYRVVKGNRPPGVIPQSVAAVKALGLDFGAVDVIVDSSKTVYVLEVNTAPGLCDASLAWYTERLTEIMEKAL